MREAHYYDLHRHGSWIMPEAVCCVHGKPERGRGALMQYSVRDVEVGPGREAYCVRMGSPTMREAHCWNYVDTHAGLGRRPGCD